MDYNTNCKICIFKYYNGFLFHEWFIYDASDEDKKWYIVMYHKTIVYNVIFLKKRAMTRLELVTLRLWALRTKPTVPHRFTLHYEYIFIERMDKLYFSFNIFLNVTKC